MSLRWSEINWRVIRRNYNFGFKIVNTFALTRNLKPERLIDAIIGKAGQGESSGSGICRSVFSEADELAGCMGQRTGGT